MYNKGKSIITTSQRGVYKEGNLSSAPADDGATMSNPITNKEQQVTYLKERLEIFLEVLDAIDPETTELEDIDRLIQMMDDIEDKMDQFQSRTEPTKAE